MSAVRDLHQQAMTLAQEALIARETGDKTRAAQLAARAFPLEQQAAHLIANSPASEPTRSILYRSAATLAYQAGDYATAQRLVAEGLAGYPAPRTEQELKDLFEQINLASHLQTRDTTLTASQMQLALTGNEVGSGQIAYSAFNDRLGALVTMIDRTMRRLMGESYQRGGQGFHQSRPFVPLISSPRLGSFAVTVEVAQKTNRPMTFLTTGDAVIDQVINGIQLVEDQQLDELSRQIPDESYLVNFVSLAQQLAPDGERVKMVGLTSARSQVSFTVPRSTVANPNVAETVSQNGDASPNGLHTYTGVLDEATSRKQERVGLTIPGEGGQPDTSMSLRVKEGMDDIVRSYFNRQVEVTVEHRGRSRILLDITDIEE